MSGISRDDWLTALADVMAAPPDDPEALTSAEFAVVFGLGTTTARIRLKRLVAEGRVEHRTKLVAGADGRQMRVAAYRLVQP